MPENETESKGFMLFPDQYEPIKGMSLEQKGKLLDAMFQYNIGQEPQIDDPLVAMAFGFFRSAFDRERLRRSNISEKRKAAVSSRWNKDKDTKHTNVSDVSKSIQADSENTNEANITRHNKTEHNKTEQNTYSSASKDDALPAMVLPAVITLPLNDGTEDVIVQPDIDEWQALYPAVDVLQELRNMRGWFLGNPTKHKTRRGIGRFIHSWLSKAQDKAGRPEQRRLSFQEEREQRELEKFLNDDRPLWGMTSSGGNNGQDPF